MEFASSSILKPHHTTISSIFNYTNNNSHHLYAAYPVTNLNLASSAFPKNSTFTGKCPHFHFFTAFSSLFGADDSNPSQEKLAVLVEVDGVLIYAYRVGNRQTFNVAFKKLGLDCANWTEPVYLDLLRKCAGDEEKMLVMLAFVIAHYREGILCEKCSAKKDTPIEEKTAMDEFLMSNSLPLRPGLEEFIDDARCEGIPVVVLSSYSKSGDAVCSLQKIIAALRAGAETASLHVSNCVLIAGSQSGVEGALRELTNDGVWKLCDYASRLENSSTPEHIQAKGYQNPESTKGYLNLKRGT